MQHIYLVKIFIFLIGLCFGSFINVCIYRLPLNKSIVSPGSFCPKCKNKLKWYHNIPLISYLFLRGKCGFCNAGISVKYPFIEMLCGCILFLNFIYFGFSIEFFTYVLFELMLVMVIFIDLEYMIIPDEVSLSGIAAGFILSFFRNDLTWTDSLFGIIIGGGILLLIIKAYFFLTKKEGKVIINSQT